MKLQSLKSSIDNFWEFQKAGDSFCGRYIETTENLGDGSVMLFKTNDGIWGVNVYSSLKQQVAKLERNKFYIITYRGLAKSKKTGRDYFLVDIIEPEPEDQSDKDQLNEWYKSVTFERPITEEAETVSNSKSHSGIDDDLPF